LLQQNPPVLKWQCQLVVPANTRLPVQRL